MAVRVLSDLVASGLGVQPHVSQAEDIARGGQSGLSQGIAGLVGQVGDIQAAGRELFDRGAEFAQRHGVNIPKSADLPKISPLGAGDIWGALGGAAGQLAAKAVNHATGAHIDPKMASAAGRLALAAAVPAAAAAAPTSGQVAQVLNGGRAPYQPQTKAGQLAQAVGQWTPAAAMPGTATQRLAAVVLPAAATEAADTVTKGTPLQPLARTAAGVLGTVVAGGLGRAPGDRLLSEATHGATDEQIGQATDLLRRAQAEGVQLTMPEALQQVTNGATGMGRLQRVVEGTRAGSRVIAPVMAERPAQVRQAVANVADTIAPATDNPSMIAPAAQEAAGQVLGGLRRDINAQARPHYEQLAQEALPEDAHQALVSDPAYAHALGTVRGNPILNADLAHLPDNNLAVVNEVTKQLDTLGENARPYQGNPNGNNQLAAAYDRAAAMARDAASGSDAWNAARGTVADLRAQELEPLQRGPLGGVERANTVQGQVGGLFPSAPLEGGAVETGAALQRLAGADPQAAQGLVRQHLMSTMNEATQDNLGGPNQWGGAKFASVIAGNPEQAQALNAGVDAVGGDTQRLGDVLDVLRATGYRERPGSMTAYNKQDLEELGRAGMAGEVLRTGLNPPGTFRRIGEAFQDFQTTRNADRLAQAILAASPEQAQEILLRARRLAPDGGALDSVGRLAAAIELSRRPDQQTLPAPAN